MKASYRRHQCAVSLFTAALLVFASTALAGTIDFAEYDGQPDNTVIPIDSLPAGVPDGVTASWTGFLLHTTAGDTPMSVFPVSTQAVVAFNPPVIVPSINAQDTARGGPMVLIGKLHGIEIWRYTSPGDHDWTKLTVGASKVIDTIVFQGRTNYFDDIVVEPAPDTDADGYVDADELATGHDPKDANNNPANSAIADSVAQFTTSGTQGENDLFYGYRNYTKDGGGPNYDPTTGFIEFPADTWTGSEWDLNTAAAAPWTELGPRNLHPNAGTGDINWPIRRWVAKQLTKVTPLAIRWHVHHANVTCGGNGVTGALYLNGQRVDSDVIGAPDNVGITHTFYANVSPNDRIDLALSAKGLDGIEIDGCDGSESWFLVDPTIPSTALQPDGSVFIPVGTGDSDADQLPDVWEKIYFPNDLTKLSRTGDYDKDNVSDFDEYQRGSDPTKPDTDGDGLTDAVESNTGKFVSKTDTGSNPTKKDTDGDGLTDDAEVNRAPPTDPNKADTDGDAYSDADELSWGTDPTKANDNPLTYVIANSEADFSGTQGKNDWYSGYRLYDPENTGPLDYDATADFVPFPGGDGQGDWDGVAQVWTGSIWDMNTAGAGPWTEEGPLNVHPNGPNSPATIDGAPDPTKEQWPIRRWIAKKLTAATKATVIWQVKKTNLNGTGVTGMLFINGKLVDSKAIEGTDGNGEIRRYSTTLKPNDVVDLALAPVGPSGEDSDGSDGSQTWFWVDTRPVTDQPTLSVTRTATGMTITFTGTLQAADKVIGPYSDTSSSGSLDVSFSSGPAKFYRARQ